MEIEGSIRSVRSLLIELCLAMVRHGLLSAKETQCSWPNRPMHFPVRPSCERVSKTQAISLPKHWQNTWLHGDVLSSESQESHGFGFPARIRNFHLKKSSISTPHGKAFRHWLWKHSTNVLTYSVSTLDKHWQSIYSKRFRSALQISWNQYQCLNPCEIEHPSLCTISWKTINICPSVSLDHLFITLMDQYLSLLHHAPKHPCTLHHSPFALHHLKEHANDGHHRQSSVCQLCIELCFLDLRISRCDEFPSKVTSCSRSSSRLVLGNFAEGHVGQNLTPTCCWHFGDCGKTIGHICKLQASRRRQVARELSRNFWSDISHCCEHRNATMLQLSLTTSLEVLNAAIWRKPSWIPETHRSLHTQLVLEGLAKEKQCSWPSHPRHFRSSHPAWEWVTFDQLTQRMAKQP